VACCRLRLTPGDAIPFIFNRLSTSQAGRRGFESGLRLQFHANPVRDTSRARGVRFRKTGAFPSVVLVQPDLSEEESRTSDQSLAEPLGFRGRDGPDRRSASAGMRAFARGIRPPDCLFRPPRSAMSRPRGVPAPNIRRGIGLRWNAPASPGMRSALSRELPDVVTRTFLAGCQANSRVRIVFRSGNRGEAHGSRNRRVLTGEERPPTAPGQ
jgi:hypothetical protein